MTIQIYMSYFIFQNKIREEVLSIIGASDNVMLHDVGSFKYMDMVINETIRLFPVGPVLPREITDDLQIGTSENTRTSQRILLNSSQFTNP